MAAYYSTVQKIKRLNPNYTYRVEISSSGGFFGGYNVTVKGHSDEIAEVDSNENFVSKYYFRRPSRKKLIELIDRMHFSIRESMEEKDWDAIRQTEMQKKLDELKAKMDAEFATELERRLKAEAERIRKEQEGAAPMKP